MESAWKSEFPPPQGPPADAGEAPHQPPWTGTPSLEPNLLDRAKTNDPAAIATMFAQFLSADEPLVAGQYMGVLGFWGIGTHSFAGVTKRRVVSLRVSLFGGILYQDAALEHTNSAAVFQPSKVSLYVFVAAIALISFGLGYSIHPVASILSLLLSFLLLPLTVRLYYRFVKSGLVVAVREGIAAYVFIDRKRMRSANALYRTSMSMREERIRAVGYH